MTTLSYVEEEQGMLGCILTLHGVLHYHWQILLPVEEDLCQCKASLHKLKECCDEALCVNFQVLKTYQLIFLLKMQWCISTCEVTAVSSESYDTVGGGAEVLVLMVPPAFPLICSSARAQTSRLCYHHDVSQRERERVLITFLPDLILKVFCPVWADVPIV